MPHRITQPTKEQVRAYMAARELARRPPPPPEEIRRQLGWRLDAPEDQSQFTRFCLLPATCGQIATRFAFDWLRATLPSLHGENCSQYSQKNGTIS